MEPIAEAPPSPLCPVCERASGELFARLEGRRYWRCPFCRATFLDAAFHPTPDDERAQYALHENRPDDPAYRGFLSRLATPLLARLPPGREGLDFGSGPGPALAAMLTEAGHRMSVYDPFFAPDKGALARRYDFIACTETAEHFHRPARSFAEMRALLRPGGVIALMTAFQTDDNRFAGWHYRKDPTHVVFYRSETFQTLARLWGGVAEIPEKDIVFLYDVALTASEGTGDGGA